MTKRVTELCIFLSFVLRPPLLSPFVRTLTSPQFMQVDAFDRVLRSPPSAVALCSLLFHLCDHSLCRSSRSTMRHAPSCELSFPCLLPFLRILYHGNNSITGSYRAVFLPPQRNSGWGHTEIGLSGRTKARDRRPIREKIKKEGEEDKYSKCTKDVRVSVPVG